MNYYFILGRQNKISQAEIQSVLASFCFSFVGGASVPRSITKGGYSVSILSDEVLEIKLDLPKERVVDLINILGGTVKIFQKIAPRDTKIADLLHKESATKKIIFAISDYQKRKTDSFKLALDAKRAYKKSVRIIAGKDGEKLSSAQSFQYEMDRKNIEYGLFDNGIGRLIAVQDINDWGEKDYGKPRSDVRSGMLPPKLARMMINIAIGQWSVVSGRSKNPRATNYKLPTIIDPFCGSGNVLLEAISLGYDIIGSDISEKAVLDSKFNVEWLLKSTVNGSGLKAKIYQADAIKFNFSQIKDDFIIVTEPYLGEPRRSKFRIEEENAARQEISKLYINFLHNLKLTANSFNLKAICIVFPLFELANGKQLSIFAECVDFLEKNGYTFEYTPLVYGRGYQVVKREIVLLKP
jgi:tRNA G10  N-methylase Trm11